ncbi:MAG TPA: L,D-transpeptidase [Mycoplana sp.]|jgi:lipoprotein-anchoring transpeptidase ErfK/SrfK|nr:L,D-transpeptidase [Mycoplana sp.]
MNRNVISRRGLLMGSLGLVLAGCTSISQPSSSPYAFTSYRVEPRYQRTRVAYGGGEPPGTIIVNTSERYLYLVEGGGRAMRYGVAVGEEGLNFKGVASIGRKAEWPSWRPTADMIRRKPRLQEFAAGVDGGPHNPLGAAALYLYSGGRDTMYRLHGTNEPWLIGHAVSNGCVRLTNDDIVDLYSRCPIGTRVKVI